MNMNKLKFFWAIILFLVVKPFSAFGLPSADQPTNFFELDLAELSNIVVTIASSNAETILETPAIVSRYDRDEMADMGLVTLKDILSFIPGVILNDVTSGPTSVMIRGVYEPYNQKVLFLLDNVPYWMPAHGEIPLLGMPIEAIDHIEVIRGPGSVYYGTNATAGVIKVVTRKDGGNRIALAGGKNGLVNGSGYYHNQFNNDAKINVGFESQRDDGYDGFFDDGSGRTLKEAEEMSSILTSLSYKKMNVLAHAFQSTTNGVAGARTANNWSEIQNTGYLLHGDYTWRFEKADIKLFSDYNNFYLKFDTKNLVGGVTDGGFRFENNGHDNYRWRSGSTVDYAWSKQLRLFAGAEYEKRASGAYQLFNAETDATVGTLVPDLSLDETSLYTQIDYNTAKWRFMAGGRFTDNDFTGSDLTPRTAVVYKINREQSIKFLHSEGFNSPNFTQSKASFPGVVQGEPSLKPERVKSSDLAYSYATNNSLFVANIFYLKTHNFIQRMTAPGGGITYFNANKFERYGGELDFQHKYHNWRLFFNLAYHHQGNEIITDDETALYAPKITTGSGFSYTFLNHHTVGASLRTTSRRGKAGNHEYASVHYKYVFNNYDFFATIRNLFDQEMLNPDVEGWQDILIAGGDGFNFLTGLRYHF
jgi:outer membrane receptor protein involved in Fe transport